MRFFIIASTLIHLSAAVAGSSGTTTVGRCCNKADILVLNDFQLQCVPATHRQLQQQLLDASTRGQQQKQQQQQANGLPYCGKYRHLEQILSEDVALEVPSESCLELFHDPSTSLNFVVFVYCSAPSRFSPIQHSRFILESRFKPAPRIVHLRKCCPGNTAYDPERKFCVEPTSNASTDFRVLFDMLPSLDFIDVYVHGPPNCYDAVLADFRVEQLYHSDTDAAGEITISIQQSGSMTNITINADTSCLDSYGDRLTARICRELDYCEENVCIRKCCSESTEENRCAAAAPTFQNFSSALGNIKNYGLIRGLSCLEVFGPESGVETWWLDDKGNLNLYDNELLTTDVYTYANFCFEFEMDERGFAPMLCFPEQSIDLTPPEKWAIGGSLQVVSCFFLLLTFMVYCCLPSLQNLHGKTLMCHVSSLFVAYATLATTQFATNSLGLWGDGIEDVACKVLGYILLLAFHSAFFWLNVMCFDIWWTFRGIREAKRRRQTSRFLAYCAYAWGSALFFVVLLLSLDLADALGDVIGKQRCWLEYYTLAHVFFFLMPVNLTLVANLIFFLLTARRCSMVKAEISRVMANDKCAKNFRSDRSRLIMNVKLFVVMGIPYLIENVQAFFENFNLMPLWAKEVFYVVDIVTSLQGVWIFILFVLKSKVYETLRKRLSPRFTMRKSSTTTSNALSVNNKLNQPRVRKSASNTTITSCFLST